MIVQAPGKHPRPVADYRELNKITVLHKFPLPNLEEMVEWVAGAEYVSILDLVRGFWQVECSDRAREITAINTHLGVFEFTKMNMGLVNATFYFQKLMMTVCRDLYEFARPYLDDVPVVAANWPQHLVHLEQFFLKIREAGLTINPAKCQLGKRKAVFLGHVVGGGHRSPTKKKVKAIQDLPVPKTKKDIRSVLGLIGYYAHYLQNYAELVAPLTDKLRKDEPEIVSWDQNCQDAFCKVKSLLSESPILAAPNFEREFLVQTDASRRGIGVVLSQLDDDGNEHPVVYLSKKLTKTEQAYSTIEQECLAVVWGVKKLAPYLAMTHFKLVTDHNPLTWLGKQGSNNGRLLRWSLFLQDLSFDVVHKKGILNGNADALSRLF